MQRDVVVDMLKCRLTCMCTAVGVDLAKELRVYCKSPEHVAIEIKSELAQLWTALSVFDSTVATNPVLLDDCGQAIEFVSSSTSTLFVKVLTQWPNGESLIKNMGVALAGHRSSLRLLGQVCSALDSLLKSVETEALPLVLNNLNVVGTMYAEAESLSLDSLSVIASEQYDAKIEKSLIALVESLKKTIHGYAERFIDYMTKKDDTVFWEVEPDMSVLRLLRNAVSALHDFPSATPFLKHFRDKYADVLVIAIGIIEAVPAVLTVQDEVMTRDMAVEIVQCVACGTNFKDAFVEFAGKDHLCTFKALYQMLRSSEPLQACKSFLSTRSLEGTTPLRELLGKMRLDNAFSPPWVAAMTNKLLQDGKPSAVNQSLVAAASAKVADCVVDQVFSC